MSKFQSDVSNLKLTLHYITGFSNAVTWSWQLEGKEQIRYVPKN